MPKRSDKNAARAYALERWIGLNWPDRWRCEYHFTRRPEDYDPSLPAWRFDFACPDARVAIELEGLRWDGVGEHQSIAGFTRNCYKYNHAAARGWILLRYTYKMLDDYSTFIQIKTAMASRGSQFVSRQD